MTRDEPDQRFHRGDVARGYSWLGHAGGVTEVAILHPEYRKGDREWNRDHDAGPITTYIRSARELFGIVHRYAGSRLLCYGINPRPHPLTTQDGRVRSGTDADITTSQTFLLDVDLAGRPTSERLNGLVKVLSRVDAYALDHGLRRPTRAITGRGRHLLFSYDPISVIDHPRLRDRLRTFKDLLTDAVCDDLNRLDARIDNTQDLRRMVRVYGTAKPDVGYLSRFLGPSSREPDPALAPYLLSLPPKDERPVELLGPPEIGQNLPDWFMQVLHDNDDLADLWENKGKPRGSDQSNSGYDYSITSYLFNLGFGDPDELATILHYRPTGYQERLRKGPDYLRRTITNALKRHRGQT